MRFSLGGNSVRFGGKDVRHHDMASSLASRMPADPNFTYDGTFEEGMSEVGKYNKFAKGCMIAGIVVFIVSTWIWFLPIQLLGIFSGIALIIIGCINFSKGARIQNYLKENVAKTIIEEALQEVFDGLTYNIDASPMLEAISSHNVGIPSGHMDDIRVSDMVDGLYKGMPIAFSDCEVTYTTRDSDGDTHTHTAFKGTYLVTQHKAALTHPVRILRTKDRAGRKPMSGWRIHDKVDLDDKSFEECFEVECADARSAYYIMTYKMMHELMSLCDALDDMVGVRCNLMLLFEPGGTLFIGFDHGQDLFELDSRFDTDTALVKHRFAHQIAQIECLLQVVHGFNGERMDVSEIER